MGSSQSSEVKQLTDITNKVMTNIVNTNTTKASATSNNKNTFKLVIGPKGSITNCNLKLGQTINASQNLKVMAKVSTVNELKSMLSSAVDNAVSQNNQAVNGFLSTAFNNQKSNTDIKNILKNEINNNITNENLTECNAVIDNLNQGELEINGKWDCASMGPIEANQSVVSAQVVECFADALQQAVMSNQSIADAVNKAEQKNISENQGADSFIKAFTGPMMWVAIAIIAIVILAVPLFLFVFRVKSKRRYYF